MKTDMVFREMVLIFIFLVLLAACTPEEPTVPATTANAQVPVSTVRLTNTAEAPTLIATLVPTNTKESPTPTATLPPTLSPTPAPTRTSRPTRLPPPSATPLFAETIVFPDWIQAPDSAVLLASLQDAPRENNVFSLVNAVIGEIFEILASDGIRISSYWYETETGLSIRFYEYLTSGSSPDHYYLHEVNISSGEERQLPLSTVYSKGKLSPDGRFAVNVVGEPGTRSATIINQETEQETALANPFDGRYSFGGNAGWSMDSKLLAANFYNVNESNPELTTYSLAIYTTEGSIYRTYTNVNYWAWATDGSYRLLALEGNDYGKHISCIVDLEIDTIDCLTEITTWRETEAENTGSYEWLPDGSGISFIYWQRTEERKSRLCIIDITSRDIICPVNETHIAPATLGAEVGGTAHLVNYLWSPDGSYVALEIDPFGPEGDDRTLTQVATIARDGSQFFLWGFGSLRDAEWRPPLGSTN